ncbi:hypothetical protein Bca52824_023055 [Brassica carinata]|uniref:Uncharacterized protein n=1 Tax=Brassica carinata TaxID=52824 RepID=A0A8X8AU34_BRACI|nr:hypothetical protein Bca52824_023055 [Brassica carinata]
MERSKTITLFRIPLSSSLSTMEELRQTLMYTTLELEQTKLVAQEELRKRGEQLNHLEDVLAKTLKERDEDNLLLQPQHNQDHITPPLSGGSSIEEEQLQSHQQNPSLNKSFSSSDTEESIMSPSIMSPLLLEKPLPEKGSLLQAVLKAGPLLQTLLLSGPLPQWRHPPPTLDTSEIPPVTLDSSVINNACGNPNKRRAFSVSDGSFSETKYENV